MPRSCQSSQAKQPSLTQLRELGLQVIETSKCLVAWLGRQFNQNVIDLEITVALKILGLWFPHVDVDHRHVVASDRAQFLELTRQSIR